MDHRNAYVCCAKLYDKKILFVHSDASNKISEIIVYKLRTGSIYILLELIV